MKNDLTCILICICSAAIFALFIDDSGISWAGGCITGILMMTALSWEFKK